MVVSEALGLGRAAMTAHRWREACERLAEARSTDAGGLAGLDLELLATALYLRGRSAAAFETLTNAHDAYLAGDDTVGAARTAGWSRSRCSKPATSPRRQGGSRVAFASSIVSIARVR